MQVLRQSIANALIEAKSKLTRFHDGLLLTSMARWFLPFPVNQSMYGVPTFFIRPFLSHFYPVH